MSLQQKFRDAYSVMVGKSTITIPPGFGEAFQRGEEGALLERWRGRKVKQPAAQHPYAHGGIRGIVDSIIQAPWTLFPRTDGANSKEIKSGPVYDLWLQPNATDTGADLWDKTIQGLLQNEYGVLWIYGFAGSSDLPAIIEQFDAADFEPSAPGGIFKGWYRRTDRKFFPREQTVWFRFPDSVNRWMSLTPFRALEKVLTGDLEAADFSNEFFSNGARLGLVITTEDGGLTTEMASMLEDKINRKHTGLWRRFKTMVLGGARWKVTDHGTSQKDMEFQGGREFARGEIRAALREGPLLFGDVKDGNRANVLGQERVVWRQMLLPLTKRLIRTVDSAFFRRFKSSSNMIGIFDTTGVEALQDDMKREVDMAVDLQKLGFTGNEVNEFFDWGFEDKPWRDTIFISATQLPAMDLMEELPALEEEDEEEEIPFTQAEVKDVRHQKALMKWNPLVVTVRKKIRNHYRSHRKKVLQKLPSIVKELSSKDQVDDVLWDIIVSSKKLMKLLDPETRKALEAGAILVSNELGVETSLSINSPEIAEYLRSREIILKAADAAARKRVETVIRNGIDSGFSLPKITAGVQLAFNASMRQAQVIALTEIVGAFNNGRALEAQKHPEDKKGKIEWLTVGDVDVRDTHARLRGSVVKFGRKFPNGLRWPHDSSVHNKAAEIVNCRCTWTFV